MRRWRVHAPTSRPGPGNRWRRARRRGHQRLGLRHDGQGLRLYVPHRAGAMARQRRAGLGAGLRHQRAAHSPRLRADTETPGLTVAYHSACSLQHGQRSPRSPRRCCNAPGSPWSSQSSRISAAAPRAPTTCCSRRSPADCVTGSSKTCVRPTPDLVAAGNIGCITQLAGAGCRWCTRWNCSTGWRVGLFQRPWHEDRHYLLSRANGWVPRCSGFRTE